MHFGSSPRVRGTSPPIAPPPALHRFIPTSAGNILLRLWCNQPKPVHPHECGEHIWNASAGWQNPGSSPRVRGTFIGFRTLNDFLRFIPTSAGNMSRITNPCCYRAVHPHECGEHIINISQNVKDNGSSPRVRGTYWARYALNDRARFIPTSAGNIHRYDLPSHPKTVHPHECGEHCATPIIKNSSAGSSPRVRGTCNHQRLAQCP